jgi:hypothetical protein
MSSFRLKVRLPERLLALPLSEGLTKADVPLRAIPLCLLVIE